MAAALLLAMLSIQGAAQDPVISNQLSVISKGKESSQLSVAGCQKRQNKKIKPLGTGNWELATITAYCLKGQKTTSGKRVYPGCLALSRPLARSLGLKSGPGTYDYRFGTRIVVEGVGCFVFDDLMPPQWRRPRVDIHRATLKECREFGLKRARVWKVSSEQ
jgi:hypothetical protein